MRKKSNVDMYAKSFGEGIRAAEKLKENLAKKFDEHEKAAEIEKTLESLIDVPLFVAMVDSLEWRLRGFSHGFVRLALETTIKFPRNPWDDEI
jgi:hypothetical protein